MCNFQAEKLQCLLLYSSQNKDQIGSYNVENVINKQKFLLLELRRIFHKKIQVSDRIVVSLSIAKFYSINC